MKAVQFFLIVLLLVYSADSVSSRQMSILSDLNILSRYFLNGSDSNITVIGDITFVEGRHPDKLAMKFSGDNSTLAVIPSLNLVGLNFTMACWVNIADEEGSKTILNKMTYQDKIQFLFKIRETTVAFQRQTSDTFVVQKGLGGTVLAGKWTHVAVTWDEKRGTYEYFTNATSGGTKTYTGSFKWFNESGKFVIGRDETGSLNTPFNGTMMELYVIGQVLTAKEINRLRGHPHVVSLIPDIFGKFFNLYENETLELNCAAEGDPLPEVKWFLNNRELTTSQLTRASLVFKATVGKDGILGCKAINNVGTAETKGTFKVRRPLRLCVDYNIINDSTRQPSITTPFSYDHTNLDQSKWYRFRNPDEARLPTRCVPEKHCGTQATSWLNGQHPRIEDGVVQRKVCFHFKKDCCYYNTTVQIRKCYGGYYVYKFNAVPTWIPGRYCLETDSQVDYPKEFTTYQQDKPAHALMNHVIHVEDDVTDPLYCMAYCQLIQDCISYNYNPTQRKCELNKSNKNLSPADYQPMNGTMYYDKVVLPILRDFSDL